MAKQYISWEEKALAMWKIYNKKYKKAMEEGCTLLNTFSVLISLSLTLIILRANTLYVTRIIRE